MEANLSEKFYFHNELRHRVIQFPDGLQQAFIRPSFRYRAKNWLEFSVGYTCAKNGYDIYILPEHNIWEQVSTKHKIADFDVTTQFRYENRFVGQQRLQPPYEFYYSFINRFRSMVQFSYSIKDYSIFVYDEVFWGSTEDHLIGIQQNWSGIGITLNFSSYLSGTFSYMQQYIKRKDYTENNMILRLGATLKL